jgi:argininosuccinate lyase
MRRGVARAAADLADYLVRKGMAFRDAHEVVARAGSRRGQAKGPLPTSPPPSASSSRR